MAGRDSFWDANAHEGEPSCWSTDTLRSWLREHAGKSSSDLQQLTKQALQQQVIAQQDQLYSRYKAKFEYNYQNVDLSSLHLWVPCNTDEGKDMPKLMSSLPEMTGAGSVEREFNGMYNISEKMASLGKTLPMGWTPEDDLRQDILLAGQSLDAGLTTLLYQTYTQDNALTVSIRKIVLLLPQPKYKPGDRVILIRTKDDNSGSSSCSDGMPSPGSMGTVAEQQQQQTSSKGKDTQPAVISVQFDGSSTAVQVPASQVMLLQQQQQQQQPREGDYVVLHGLKQQPQLAGRLARLQKMPKEAKKDDSEVNSSSSSSNADARCQVTLAPFLTAAASGGVKQQQQQYSKLQQIAPRLSCIAAVQQPQCALVIAYASHNNKTQAAAAAGLQFMTSQQHYITPINNVKTTPREQGVVLRYIQQCKDMLSHHHDQISHRLSSQLLGDLAAKHWTLGLMVPVKQPLSDAEQQRKLLKKERRCRHCDVPGSKDQKLHCCSVCGSVWYCSKECQKADWKARHKKECKKSDNAAGDAGASSSAAASSSNGSSSSSILVPLAPSQSSMFKGQHVLTLGGHTANMNKLPTNKHGDKEFIVKISSNVGPDTATDVMIYDQARSFMAFVTADQNGHQQLADILRRVGRPGRLDPRGRAGYVRAKREGVNLRVFLDVLPDQQQHW